jgi:putative tryptophan/tyrosine transport system substrate-binding protein
LPNPVTGQHNQVIADLTVRHRIPSISPFRYFADSGGLLAYGPDIPDLFRRPASYVDRTLKGEKPVDLSVQAPT